MKWNTAILSFHQEIKQNQISLENGYKIHFKQNRFLFRFHSTWIGRVYAVHSPQSK